MFNVDESRVLTMPYITFSSPVNALLKTVWNVVVDKIENTTHYNPAAQNPKILKRYNDGVLRQMQVLNMTVTERITIDEKAREIRHTLVDNPFFTGKTINTIVQSTSNNPNEPLIISYTMDWQPVNQKARKLEQEIQEKLVQAVQHAVLSAKNVAEKQEAQKELHTQLEATTTNESKSMPERPLGTTEDMVKRLFSRGEAFDSEGFITFFTDTPLYQFGNFEVCLDKESIKKSADAFFSKISAVYHDIKMMWEVGDVAFVEMDVTYWRQDSSVISLPCFDIFRVEGDKFSELRIFMDVNPVFDPSIPVSPSSSVMTVSEGRRLSPPETMKKFFAEHPEGKKRVATGFAPKWSIADPPKWPIKDAPELSSGDLISKVEKMVEALTVEDWKSFYPYFTDDLYYKVGANYPVYGPKSAAEYLSSFYKTVKPTKHDLRGTWQIGNTVIVEMDANYRRISDGKPVTVPCTDVYRFEGDLIKEWRVYPDVSEVYGK
jgi:limonene-1,2-epoxide hydrolase